MWGINHCNAVESSTFLNSGLISKEMAGKILLGKSNPNIPLLFTFNHMSENILINGDLLSKKLIPSMSVSGTSQRHYTSKH